MSLRNYQQRAIDDLYKWLSIRSGHPCLVLPTGAGKSHIIAALCKDAIQNWPETRILMLTHQKELIEQNAEKLRHVWAGAPMGIYSASVGRKELGEPITFAGIQSIRKKSAQVGHVDLIIIDECHLVSHKDEGSYRTFIAELASINPYIRVIGLTATPWRLGHGIITDKPAIFDDLVEPVSIEELIALGFLSPLQSKLTDIKYDLAGVHKRGGEFIEQELAAVINTDTYNDAVTNEIIKFGHDRKSWLIFCSGIDHATEIANKLSSYTSAAYITGDTPKGERQRILADFKAGRIQALTNANVLTTGFDAPNIDLIAMLRPTMSPSLYVQMAGRGMRLADDKANCLVLDFAGNVQRHGPITYVQPPSKSNGKGDGEAPVKSCEHCMELVHLSAKVCPACGEPFPEPEVPALKLHNDDIMGLEAQELSVTEWVWKKHTSRNSGLDMLMVTYFGNLSDRPVKEYFPVKHIGYAGEKSLREIGLIAQKAGVSFTPGSELDDWASTLNQGRCPFNIKYRMDGKYHRVVSRNWNEQAAEA